MKPTVRQVIALAAALLLLAATAGWTQEATVQPEAALTEVSSILIKKMEWVLSDMMRCIEELRRVEDNWSKRLLIEQLEEILYREVEFPLIYQQADNVDALDVAPIGASSDIIDSGEANPMAPMVAEAFALMGIAKGYEGYAAAATDYIDHAREIYADVLSVKMRIDSFQDPQTLGQWIADARGRWGATNPVRVTFYGKAVNQEVVDGLNIQTVSFQADENAEGLDYHLHVARRDFLRGMRRQIVTNDLLTKRRKGSFSLYLPPGDYRLVTGLSQDVANAFEVHTNPNRNHCLIETLEVGIAVYPVPNIRELGALLDPDQTDADGLPIGADLEPGEYDETEPTKNETPSSDEGEGETGEEINEEADMEIPADEAMEIDASVADDTTNQETTGEDNEAQ